MRARSTSVGQLRDGSRVTFCLLRPVNDDETAIGTPGTVAVVLRSIDSFQVWTRVALLGVDGVFPERGWGGKAPSTS